MKKIPYVIAAFLLLLPVSGQASDLADLPPESVGPMHRVQLVTGDAAQAEVDKLHGKALPAEASVVARYAVPGEKGRPAEVWISRVESENEARRQTGQMVHLMYENPRSPFKNPRRMDHRGNAVYRFEGMGQAHLIWYKHALVYWISVSPEREGVMLDEFSK